MTGAGGQYALHIEAAIALLQARGCSNAQIVGMFLGATEAFYRQNPLHRPSVMNGVRTILARMAAAANDPPATSPTPAPALAPDPDPSQPDDTLPDLDPGDPPDEAPPDDTIGAQAHVGLMAIIEQVREHMRDFQAFAQQRGMGSRRTAAVCIAVLKTIAAARPGLHPAIAAAAADLVLSVPDEPPPRGAPS